jgi:hypothetical protein
MSESKFDKDAVYAHPGWQWCTAEGSRQHTLLMGLRSTFREKLEWLEEAESLTRPQEIAESGEKGLGAGGWEMGAGGRAEEQSGGPPRHPWI